MKILPVLTVNKIHIIIVFFCLELMLPGLCYSKADVLDSAPALQQELVNSRSSLESAKLELIKATGALESTEKFYGSLLTTVLGIIGFLALFSWLWSGKIADQQIERKIFEAEKRLHELFEAKQKTFNKDVRSEFQKQTELQEFQVNRLEAQVCRSLAHLWDTQKLFITSYLWWMRSAKSWNEVKDVEMVKIALVAASTALSQSSGISTQDPKYIAETQEIIDGLNLEGYKSEKEKVQTAFKEALARKGPG